MGAIGFPTCVSSPEISHSYCLRFGLSPSFPRLIWVRGLSPVQRGSRSKVRHPQLAITGIGSRRILISFSPLVTRLEVRALRLGLGEPSQMAEIQGPARAVINMSLLAYLFIPEDFITEGLLHLPLFPRTGRSERRTSPSASILPDSGLRDSQSKRSRPKLLPGRGPQLPYLRQPSAKRRRFTSPEISVLGARFQTQCPLGMDDLGLHRFRTMFRNLRSLTITIFSTPSFSARPIGGTS